VATIPPIMWTTPIVMAMRRLRLAARIAAIDAPTNDPAAWATSGTMKC
jgi:hypothetical protein